MLNPKDKWYEQKRRDDYELDWYREKATMPFFRSFKEYLEVYPEWAENCHPDYIARELKRVNTIYLPGDGCLMGGYIMAFIRDSRNSPYRPTNLIEVVVNDGDDGYISKEVQSVEEGLQEFENLINLYPFHFWDLNNYFGYEYE